MTSICSRIRARIKLDTNGCWIWQLCCNPGGYGNIQLDGRTQSAHRVSYEAFNGPIPDGMEIDHLCRTKNCVNPAHLEAVTHKVNMERGNSGKCQLARTHCPQGHEYTEENTYRSPGRPHRQCRICGEAARRRFRERKAQESKRLCGPV